MKRIKTYNSSNTPLINACQYLEDTYRIKHYIGEAEIPWDVSEAIDILIDCIGGANEL